MPQVIIELRTGMLYNVIVSFLVFSSCLYTASSIYLRDKRSMPGRSFAAFLMAMGSLWFLSALSNFFAWLGILHVSLIFSYLERILLVIQFIPLAYFLSYSIFKNEETSLNTSITFAVVGLFFYLSFIISGAPKQNLSYWGVNWEIAWFGKGILVACLMLPIFIMAALSIYEKIKKWVHEKAKPEFGMLLVDVSVLIYALLESVNVLIAKISSGSLIIRLLYIIIAFIAYFSFPEEKFKEEFVPISIAEALAGIKGKIRIPFFMKLLILFLVLSVIPILIFGILMFITFKEIIDIYIYKPLLWNLKTSREEFLLALTNVQVQVLFLALLTILLVIIVSSIASRGISESLRRIGRGMKRIAEGDLSFKIKREANDEIGDLVNYFNTMAKEIKEAREKLEEWNRELEKTVDERTKDLRTLYNISKAMGSTLDLNALLEKSIDFVLPIIGAQIFLVLLPDEAGSLRIKVGRGIDENIKKTLRLERGVGLAGEAMAKNEIVISKDLTTDPRLKYGYFRDIGVKTMICVPLKSKGKVTGVLAVGTLQIHEYADREINMLSTIADQMAIAIENASVYEKEKEAVARLLEIDKMKTEFISMVSHELRTPLTSINGFVSHFLEGTTGELNETQRKFLEIMKAQGGHLLSLIDGLLDFSRVETGRFEIKKEIEAVDPIILEVIEGIRPQLEAKKVALTLNLGAKDIRFIGDKERIRQVLLNLINNAIKFSPENPIIEVKSYEIPEKNLIQVSVKDNGMGLEKDSLEKIFDKFYQVDSSLTRKVGGIGLGLAISKEIIEAHGGKIWAESPGVGHGSCFSFTLPKAA